MGKRIIFSFCALLTLFPIIVPAADLPALKPAANIREGYLDNGIKYYIVKNSGPKGMLDLALVQKAGSDDESGRSKGAATVQARGALANLPHFQRRTPQEFFASNGIRPAKSGYVETLPDATIFRFTDIPVSERSDAADSTMLLMFDIIGRGFKADGMDYTPQNHAVIASGDIDPDKLVNKMNMLSMLVTRRSPANTNRRPYSWLGTSDIKVKYEPALNQGIRSFTIRYRLPRTPKENMATIQPLVAWKYASELEILLRRRLGKALCEASLPYTGIDINYRSSENGCSDESFSISVSCRPADAVSVMKTVAATLASIDKEGIAPEEYRGITRELATRLRNEVRTTGAENGSYLQMCISAYLYGSSLAAPKDRMDFFLSRNLGDATGARLFNGFVTALLDKSRNMDVSTDSEQLDEDTVWRIFYDAWGEPKALTAMRGYADTTAFRRSGAKARLKNSIPDPISGGQLHTFSNGQRVVYKNTGDDGLLHFSWRVKGGYSQIPGLKRGEGACVSEIAALAKISGIRGREFMDILNANGIDMRMDVSLSDIRISGSAPEHKFPLVMKALLSYIGDREADPEAFAFYRECEKLEAVSEKDRIAGRMAILDNIMTPDNNYSAFRTEASLSDNLEKKVEKFLAAQFAKMNDGVLVITGKADEVTLKKTLSRYMGGFDSERIATNRFRSRTTFSTGRISTKADSTCCPLYDISLSTRLDYDPDNRIAAVIAMNALSEAAASAASNYGWYTETVTDFSMFPEERIRLSIMTSPASRNGLPADMLQTCDATAVAAAVRRAIGHVAKTGIDRQRLEEGKKMAINTFDKTSPEGVTRLVELRYSYGKDMASRYTDKAKAVSAEAVNQVIRALAEGALAEHCVYLNDPGEKIAEPEIPVVIPAGPQLPEYVPAAPEIADPDGLSALFHELYFIEQDGQK